MLISPAQRHSRLVWPVACTCAHVSAREEARRWSLYVVSPGVNTWGRVDNVGVCAAAQIWEQKSRLPPLHNTLGDIALSFQKRRNKVLGPPREHPRVLRAPPRQKKLKCELPGVHGADMARVQALCAGSCTSDAPCALHSRGRGAGALSQPPPHSHIPPPVRASQPNAPTEHNDDGASARAAGAGQPCA